MNDKPLNRRQWRLVYFVLRLGSGFDLQNFFDDHANSVKKEYSNQTGYDVISGIKKPLPLWQRLSKGLRIVQKT
jgi:hypothetical protein